MAAKYIVAMVLGIAQPAFSCSRGSDEDVFFERNTAEISAVQHQRIEKWVQTLKSIYKPGGTLIISPNVEDAEQDGQALGRARELAVRLALIDLGFTAVAVEPTGHVATHSSRILEEIPHVDAKRVELEYLPDCSPS